MAPSKWLASLAVVLLLLGVSAEARAQSFDVPPGRLGDAVTTLGTQSGATIVLSSPDLAGRRSPGVRGRMTMRAALDRVLRGTDTEAVFLPAGVIQVRQRRHVPPRTSVRSRPSSNSAQPAVPEAEIIVTASKQDKPLSQYPGSARIVDLSVDQYYGHGTDGSAAITELLPTLSSTNLGNARNKLFIRGVADSSFSGPTETTSALYWGDVRLTYSSPDPDLSLYDVERVELLPGPQGTLYGAGALGGIVRLVPAPPDLEAFTGGVSITTGVTKGGGASADAAAIVNWPIEQGGLAVRLVAYRDREGGYIDAPSQNRENINGTRRYGARLSIRAEDIRGWTIDAGSLFQNVRTGDGQYVLRGDPAFTRRGQIPQPFDNNYRLGYISLARSLGGMNLISVFSAVRHIQESVFDGSAFADGTRPIRYTENNNVALFTNETRLSGGTGAASWTAGMALSATDRELRLSYKPEGTSATSAGQRDKRAEVSAFGQISRPISSTLTGSLGGRLTVASAEQQITAMAWADGDMRRRTDVRFAGTAGFNWQPRDGVSLFYNYQQGYRPGGVGISVSEDGLTSRRFDTDALDAHEFGIRWGRKSSRFSGQVAISKAFWKHIQADQIVEGIPFTSNIGNGVIDGLDAELRWRVTPSLLFDASAFLNWSRLTEPADIVELDTSDLRSKAYTLPNVAPVGLRVGANWEREVGPGHTLRLRSSVRYVGRSYLGVGDSLHIPQGDYWVIDAGARLETPIFGISIAIDNLVDAQGNTFSYGNPFNIAAGDQITPLRPRSLRIGIDAHF